MLCRPLYLPPELSIPADRVLFHSSQEPDKLAKEGFNVQYSRAAGAFQFTDRLSTATNCVVSLQAELVLADLEICDEQLGLQEYSPGRWERRAEYPSDGLFIHRSYDEFTCGPEGGQALEITIFAKSLRKLGEINRLASPYPDHIWGFTAH